MLNCLRKVDEELFEIVFGELKSILGLREKPAFMHIKRWRKGDSAVSFGLRTIENGIEEFERKNKGIHFCSNFIKASRLATA
jgi:hypothetical protein